MPKNFLVGNFLCSHDSVFGRIKPCSNPVKGLPPDKLARRFTERERLYRQRLSRYNTRIMSGMVASLLVTIMAFQLNIVSSDVSGVDLTVQEVVQMEDIVQTHQEERPPPPPRPPVPVEVPNDVLLDEADLNLDAALDLDMAIADLPPPPPPPATQADKEAEEPEVFVVVEEMPEMLGGMAALLADLVYPPIAQRAELEGTVIVRVIIDEQGNPLSPEILRSVHDLLDAEAMRAVMLQKFKVAKQRGIPVRVYFSIPVRFTLN